jgi:adenylate kinase
MTERGIMKIVMLGAPGAGKGTQALNIAKEYNIPHISTGDIFRANIKNQTELGMKAKEYMDKGALVPDDITIGMLLSRIAEPDCENGFVLDGFPRTIPQAESLKKALSEQGAKIDYAVDIEVPDDNIINRMSGRRACTKCGGTYHIVFNPPKKEGICDNCGSELVQRADDKPETVLERLKTYHELTQPLIDFYKGENVLVEVDGTKKPSEVLQDILGALK